MTATETSLTSFDILVVGGGMVGAALALGALQQGWRVGVVDLKPLTLTAPGGGERDVADYDLRVSALTEASRRFLSQLGVWSTMQSLAVSPYRHMAVWDSEGQGHIEFNAADLQARELGHIVENRVTLYALHHALAQAAEDGKLAWFTGSVKALSAPVNGQRQLTLSDGQSLQAAVVVGADGAESRLRELAGISRIDSHYGHKALVTTIRTEKPHQWTAWQRFMPQGPLALLPLDNPHLCSIVWSSEPEHINALMALEDDAFCEALNEGSEQRLGKVLASGPRASVDLRLRHALQYQTEQVVLVGDAAHTIHPLAGQGVNLGFKDVQALLEQWQQAFARRSSPGHSRWLQGFQRARKADNWMTMAGMSGFKALFGSSLPGVTLARNLGLSWINALPSVKRVMAAHAMGLSDR